MSQTSTQSDPRALWEAALAAGKVRESDFTTISGSEVRPMYGPSDVDIDYDRDLGYPGQFPYTRGVHPSMYRGRL